MKNKYKKGSEWRKWDLHIHTPMSIEQHYGGDTEEVWENFIQDLEKLPKEYKVIGINDYNFIDGYKKVCQYKNKGRLKNIELILPIIELRLSIFGGKDKFSSINYHIIFSDKVNPDEIQSNFINLLKVKVSGDNENFIRSKDDIQKYGKILKEKHIVQDNDSDLNIGFKNARFDIKEIKRILNNNFGGNYLLAIGKSEWEDIRWDSAPVEKKDIINNSHFVFTGSEKLKQALKGKENLKKQGVNNNLLHFSDAHYFSDNKSVNNNLIGKSFTWIKADPTFEGLKQIIYEPEERVFIGEKLEVLDRVKNNPNKYIKSLEINQVNGYNENNGIWFKNQKIELNKELVAIIGNKGNGKSAIADILGFLGNTHNSGTKGNNFSFLNNDRFKKKSLANNFEGVLTWEDGIKDKKNLGIDEIDENKKEKVRYLPQNFFDTLTNDLENKKFKETLENVIFSHLEESLKLGKTSFEELKEYKLNNINKKINEIKKDLIEINKKIIKLEKQKQPEELKRIKNQIVEKENELNIQNELLKGLKEVKNPNKDEQTSKENKKQFEKIDKLNKEVEKIDEEIKKIKNTQGKLEIEKQTLNDFLSSFANFEKQIENYKNENKEKYLELGFNIDEIIKLSIKKDKIEQKLEETNKELEILKYKFVDKKDFDLESDEEIKKLIIKNSLIIKKEKLLEEIEQIKKDLTQQEKEYQDYLEEKKRIKFKIKEIVGEKEQGEERYKPNTLEYYKSIKKYIFEKDESGKSKLEKELDILKENRLKLSLNIYEEKEEIIKLYKEFKKPIDEKVKKNKEDFDRENEINIDVKFLFKQNFNEKFLQFINQGKKGSFSGKKEGEEMLKKIYNEKDLNNKNDIKEILNTFIEYLNIDKREDFEDKERNIFDQINDLEEFYNYIFSLDYIDTEFELKSGNKSLEKLSPGEKGTLLLIFYLLIDSETIPLIIDQPEDNLDNQSVFNMLSKFIKKAKKKRQIIIITHNPNLAVGADAEQIIFTKIDKENKNTFSFESGSIENKEINNYIVDILEGTMNAFKKRDIKYIKE